MAFKDDASFLHFVTMGALGTRVGWAGLEQAGHRIVELERYCCSNKIWATKVKRLRLPDLLCLRCGRRFEVRTKTSLEIKMSHSPTNPDRVWDAGMRDNDVAVFLRCRDEPKLAVANTLNCFEVSQLRATQPLARLGPPKSASEGAERDLTWPSWVPSASGRITAIEANGAGTRLTVSYANGRQYTYRANGKHVYGQVGTTFVGEEQILASVVPSQADVRCAGDTWTPIISAEASPAEIFTALKGLTYRLADGSTDQIRAMLDHADPRIRLEAAAALARRDEAAGLAALSDALNGTGDSTPWALEAAFILAEVHTPNAIASLQVGARSAPHPEARSACLWGLRGDTASLATSLQAATDADESVAIHAAIVGATQILNGESTTLAIAHLEGDPKRAAVAMEALARAQSPSYDLVLAAASAAGAAGNWAFTALSRMNPDAVRQSAAWHDAPAAMKDGLTRAWFSRESSWLDGDNQHALDVLARQHL
ncbi:MAG: hypothetical protein IT435_02200 [Phycisphaerales bacterium]|nr:hypothetical protein [Phycisphaerales bacterium]